MEALLAFILGIIAAVIVLHIRTIIPLEEELKMVDDELTGLKLKLKITHRAEDNQWITG